jgi:hypothetical protein
MITPIKDAILRLAANEDSEYLHHPEQFLTTMSRWQAKMGNKSFGSWAGSNGWLNAMLSWRINFARSNFQSARLDLRSL